MQWENANKFFFYHCLQKYARREKKLEMTNLFPLNLVQRKIFVKTTVHSQ